MTTVSAFASMSDLAGTVGVSPWALGLGALAAGLASSVHCFAMCGPLACAGCARSSSAGQRRNAIGAYHAARIVAYGAMGGATGLAGRGLIHFSGHAVSPWLPWAMAAVLLATALGLGERVASIPPLGRIVRTASRWGAKHSPVVRSAVLGAVTPLLPCGLLVGLFATALLTGGAASGALVAGAFATGGLPALGLAQVQAAWLDRLPRGWDAIVRRAVPAAAALLLVYRALTPESCPLCP